MKNKKIIIILVAVLVVLIAVFFLLKNNTSSKQETTTQTTSQTTSEVTTEKTTETSIVTTDKKSDKESTKKKTTKKQDNKDKTSNNKKKEEASTEKIEYSNVIISISNKLPNSLKGKDGKRHRIEKSKLCFKLKYKDKNNNWKYINFSDNDKYKTDRTSQISSDNKLALFFNPDIQWEDNFTIQIKESYELSDVEIELYVMENNKPVLIKDDNVNIETFTADSSHTSRINITIKQ